MLWYNCLTRGRVVSLANIYPETSPTVKANFDSVDFETAQFTPERPYIIAHPDEEQLHQAQKLRTEVYFNELGILEEDDLDSEGLDRDNFDEISSHLVVFSEEGIVGNMRLIPKEENIELPVEEFFGIEVPEGCVEASRYIVRTDKRGNGAGFVVSLALIRSAVEESVEQGAPYLYMTIEDDLAAHFKNIGIPIEQASEPKFVEKYKTTNTAFRVKPEEILDAVWKEDVRLRPTEKGTLRNRKVKAAPFFLKGVEGENRNFGPADLKFDRTAVERNLGFVTQEEQEKIIRSKLAIAGTGGDGGALALDLARMGVNKFKLADPEVFERENLNRQAGSSYRNLGRNKAEVIAEAILEINPYADVEVYNQGVNQENVEDFIKGSDLVIDEVEFTMPHLGAMIARESRKQEKNVLMALNVGFGCYVTSFDASSEQTFEAMMGLREDMPLEEIANVEVPLERWVGHIPTYLDPQVLEDVGSGKITAPSVSPGVGMAAGVAATEALWHILGSEDRPQPTFSPNCLSFDAVDGFRRVENTPEGFRRSLGALMLKNGITPQQ